jgi:hypothetical protein
LIDSGITGRVDIIMKCVVFLAVLGKTSDGLLQLLERRLLRWTDTFRGGAKALPRPTEVEVGTIRIVPPRPQSAS